MIITCVNCFKKFNISSDLIPDKGRLLECSSCNHQWFFKKNSLTKDSTILVNDNIKNHEELTTPNIEDEFVETSNEESSDNKIFSKKVNKSHDNELIDSDEKTEIVNKKPKILSSMIIFIISFIALIILVDTFKSPISKIVPDIEIILYNLYESIKDIKLFLNDLIL